jgi:isoquinoline 1-oxidoreductase beta subunit
MGLCLACSPVGVVAAVDCGWVVNPRPVEMQVESGVIYGLTAALFDAITIKDGAVVPGNFDTCGMVRMADAPRIETYLTLSRARAGAGLASRVRRRWRPPCAMRSSP